VFGGTAPLVATALLKACHGSWVPVAISVMAGTSISLLSTTLAPETRGAAL
jgi:hypothetical protein